MRLALVVLIGCSGSAAMDAGPPEDAGRDAGPRDAGVGGILFRMTYIYEIMGPNGCAGRPICQAQATPDAGHAAELAALYRDAGCVVSLAAETYAANCNALCGGTSPNGCCDAWAPGCGPLSCDWIPP